MPENFRNRLREWMAKEGISQGAAARRLGISRPWLNRVVSGNDEPGAAFIRTFNEITAPASAPEKLCLPNPIAPPGDFADYLRTLPTWFLLARIRELLNTAPFDSELYADIYAEISRRIGGKDLPPPL